MKTNKINRMVSFPQLSKGWEKDIKNANTFIKKVCIYRDIAYELGIIHAYLVFKIILNSVESVGVVYNYQHDLVLKAISSMLQSIKEKYKDDEDVYYTVYNICLRGENVSGF